MNNLSWFLYLADVLPSFARALTVCSFMIVLVIGVGTFFLLCCRFDAKQKQNGDDVKEINAYLKCTIPLLIVFSILWTLSFFVPSRQTIYMIAASESGEMIVNTPEAKEIFIDLRQIIKNYAYPNKEK